MAVAAARKPAPAKTNTAQQPTRAPAQKTSQSSSKKSSGSPTGALVSPPVVRLSTSVSPPEVSTLPEEIRKVIVAPGAGSELPAQVQQAIADSLQVNISPVRVHSDGRANAAVDSIGARAFTYGTHIYLGSKESSADSGLLMHEAAHVIQQQALPGVQMKTGSAGTGTLESEADAASAAVGRGESFTVAGRTTGATIQRQDGKQSLWDRGAKWLSEKADAVLEFSESVAWKLLDQFAPDLVPIIRQGPLEWLKERVSSALEAVFNSLMAPVRSIMGAGRWLSSQFAPLITWIQEAAAKIAQNDCSPMREAAEKIEKCALKLITPVVEKLQAVAEKVKGWFTGLWDKFGAPVWNWIKQFAGAQWEKLKNLATLIWEKAAPIRERLAKAWTWIKNKLGIGDGAEGQNGILQWVQDKLAVAWDWIKAKLEPFKKELLIIAGVVGSVALLASPAGPLVVIGGIVFGVLQGIRWIKANFGKGDGVVRARAYLEKTLIPSLLGSLDKATAAVTRMATSLNGALGGFAAGMGRLASSATASMLKFVVSAVQWIATQVTELAQWGSEKLASLSKWVNGAFAKLQQRLQPLLSFLGKVGEVVVDIMKLPMLVVGALWKLIPECLRNLFVDFLVNQILKRIPIVKDVVELLPGIWSKLKATGLMLIRKVFKDGDLMGAAFEIFKLVLAALKIPMELVTGIISKAATARDMILKDPLGFLGNMLRAIKQGFIQFGEKIWAHLTKSIVDWLKGVIESAGLKPPADFSLASVLDFILQVLGLSVEIILERLEKKLGKETTDKIRKALSTIAKIWEWISTALNEGPQGVWNNLKQRLGDLWGVLLDGAIGWVTGKVTKIALPRITAALGTAPIGAVVEAIVFLYNAIQTAAQYAKRILELVSSVLDGVLDIARGAIAGAANIVEASLGRALTVVIGFFANYLGLGDLGKKLKEIVESIQEKVSKAIDWVIDKAIALGKGIINAITKAAKGVMLWWKKRVPFKTAEGEQHSIFIEGDPPSEKIVVQSDKTFVDELIAKITDPAKKKKAQSIKKSIEAILAKDNKSSDETALTKAAKDIETELAALALLLPVQKVTFPAPVYTFTESAGRAKKAKVENLSALRPWGTTPGSAEPKGWRYAQVVGATATPPGLRRLHLINERFGGPGTNFNLAVASKHNNEQHLYDVENKIKTYVGDVPNEKGKDTILDYVIEVIYGRKNMELSYKKEPANLNYYPTAFKCEWTFKKVPSDKKLEGTTVPVRLDFDDNWEDKLI